MAAGRGRALAMRGTIQRRLLVNALVDPGEAQARLPDGLRAHVTESGTVVGCCILEIGSLRPAPAPPAVGLGIRAVAHRIAAEWEAPDGHTEVGVYVPIRLTDSRMATLVGGRLFPGVHRRAGVRSDHTPDAVSWTWDGGEGFRVDVTATRHDQAPVAATGAIGDTCIGATVGLSPKHNGQLESARMEVQHHEARVAPIEDLDSTFIAGFSSSEPAPSFLMEDVEVTWRADVAPQTTHQRLGGGWT